MEPLVLDSVQTFYVGGTTRVVQSVLFGDDTLVSGAMYVQHWVPANLSFSLPVIFIHGGMHTGVTWETTPDGREGWQILFARGGFETLIVDQAWRGRSAPDVTGMGRDDSPAAGATPFACGMRLGANFTRGGPRFANADMRHYAAQLWPDFGVADAIARAHPA